MLLFSISLQKGARGSTHTTRDTRHATYAQRRSAPYLTPDFTRLPRVTLTIPPTYDALEPPSPLSLSAHANSVTAFIASVAPCPVSPEILARRSSHIRL